MFTQIKLLAVSFFTILILDMIWLGLIANSFYVRNLLSIGRIEDNHFKPVLWAAGLVYLFLAFGIKYFLLPRVDPGSGFVSIFLLGAFLGSIIYGVYDMTNYSTLKDFPVHLALADIVWGSCVCGIASVATVFVRDL